MTFSDAFLQKRLALHLTQVEIAAALGVSSQTVSNWESGRTEPWRQATIFDRLDQLQADAKAPRPRICDALNLA